MSLVASLRVTNDTLFQTLVILSYSPPSHSVADINQGLIDDGLVDKEKIGGTNYFWSFPAKKDRKMQLDHDQTLKDLEILKKKITESTSALADAKRGREDEDGERAKKLARLNELETERKAALQELEALKENDPQALADLEQELKLVTDAANRWTDNIFTSKTYLTKKRGLDKKEACKILGITDSFDCKYSMIVLSGWNVVSILYISIDLHSSRLLLR